MPIGMTQESRKDMKGDIGRTISLPNFTLCECSLSTSIRSVTGAVS